MSRYCVAVLEHVLDVLAGFGEADVVDLELRASPGVDVAGPAVVGGERGDLVARVEVEEVVEVVGAVADVELGVGEILVDEGLAAAETSRSCPRSRA